METNCQINEEAMEQKTQPDVLCDSHAQNNNEDILVITAKHSEPGILWVNYLKTCFDKITKQRGRVPFKFLHVKIDKANIASDLIQRCLGTKLQIVVICPSLLEFPGSFLMSQLSAVLKPDKVLGLLLDVTEERVADIHKTSFPSYKLWRRCVVRNQDQSVVSDFLGIATDILGRALRQQPLQTENYAHPVSPLHTNANNNNNNNKLGQADNFTILPRKVKIGQNKVVVLLNDPLSRDDWIKIKMERTGHTVEITNVKRRNPYAIQFTIPDVCMEVSTMINVRVEKNSQDLGSRPIKCESRLKELETILKFQDTPVEFMCTAMGIGAGDKEKLDSALTQSFKKNVPPGFYLLTAAEKEQVNFKTREQATEDYPTMLHFAARWGLEKLCVQLLECPGSDDACELKNISGKTPAELAELYGHIKLSSTIRNFSQMNEFSTMYQFFKGISDRTSEDVTPTPSKMEESEEEKPNGEGYLVMSASGSDVTDSAINAVSNLNYLNVDDTEASLIELDDMKCGKMTKELKITEPAYFESNEVNQSDLLECTNTLEQLPSLNSSLDGSGSEYQNDSVKNHSMQKKKAQEFSDYLTHPSNIPVTSPNYTNISMLSPKKIRTTYNESSHLRLHFKKKDEITKANTLKRQVSDVSKKSVDDELLEIINDFKNNVFTIQEVEQLVATWTKRNDVKKSFVEKAEQLQRMREEYDRIQKEMKEKLKRPTPFERMKKLFSRSKSHPKDHAPPSEASTPTVDDIKFSLVTNSNNNHRPISSLSLHSVSSSSSGRMSTGSACSSLGDSGTHSDNDNLNRTRNNLYAAVRNTSHLENYLIPPAPRPVLTPVSTPTPSDEKDRPQFPKTNPAAEHYILFPSNVPYKPNETVHVNDYMNFPTLKTIDESETEIPVSVQSIKIKSEVTYAQATLKSDQSSSSFKPNSPAVTIANRPSHAYNDVNKNTEQLLNELKFNEMCKSIEDLTTRSPSSSSGTNSTLQSPHHEYMNIKI